MYRYLEPVGVNVLDYSSLVKIKIQTLVVKYTKTSKNSSVKMS